jgi:hypothetical protein
MIHLMFPVLASTETPPPAVSWWRRLVQRKPERMPLHSRTLDTLDLIDRVRGAEAKLARLKIEQPKGASCGRG